MSEETPSETPNQSDTGPEFANTLAGNLLSASFLIASLLGLFYLFGRAFYEGYTEWWGLNRSLFPASRDWLYAVGFSSFAAYLPFFVGLLVVLVVLVVGFLLLVSLILPCIEKHAQPFISCLRVLLSKLPFKSLIRQILVILGTLFVVTLVYWLFDNQFEKLGEEEAVKQREDFEKSSNSIIFLDEEDKLQEVSGHVLACSETFCAIYIENKGMIQTIKLAKLERVNSKVKQR